jgi:GNAT superfamily N-acetyltransferase
MRGTYRSPDFQRSVGFAVVPTEVRHGPGSFDVIHLANGYPIPAERRARHADFVAQQLERFPEGQFVAVVERDGEEFVVGTATTLRTQRPPEAPPLTWKEVIGDYGLPRHDPDGAWLYGVEIAVHPDYQRRGIASALYRARLALVPELGLEGWYAGGMLMGYHRFADVLTPRAYAERVVAGELVDPTVTMQMRRGLEPRGIIEDYYPEAKAGNCAVLLVWAPQRSAPARGRLVPGPTARGGRRAPSPHFPPPASVAASAARVGEAGRAGDSVRAADGSGAIDPSHPGPPGHVGH